MPKKEGHRTIKIKKSSLATILVVVGVLAIAIALIISKSMNSGTGVSPQLAKCIGAHSHVYTLTGCSHCIEQESLFGDNWKYTNSTNCNNDPQACNVIVDSTGYIHTPTWIINNQSYIGVQSIDKLKELTDC